MQIKPEQLSKVLTKQLDSLYFVFGPELLLVEQSLTHIKNTAKAQGFDERISFEVNGNFDWGKIIAELSATSLFSSKRIIECRLTTGKIGQKGSKALTKIAANVADDILFIVSTGKLDFAQQKSKWFKTLEANGNIVQAWEVQRDHLVGWIANHMTELGLESSPKIAENIAYYTEGNLLASLQEIQKLKMAYPNGNIDIEDYIQQLGQQSQYTIYNLIDSALMGDSEQVLKIYALMTTDTAMPIMLSGALYREINSITDMAIELQQVKQVGSVMSNHKVWKSRQTAIGNALKRLPYQRLQKILLSLGRIDRSIKGVDNLNVIDELRILLLTLAGKTLWTQ
ncbi:DNA polymerase III delta subunit (EC 2.7.7.7) [uncultured Gammaproteobacteria bacterium]|jgi:DNA polymerase-3 subunit delta|uniref:DNA polymerase III subunit delta n=1 Tax=thiotrophic endosymbiont of Bathymodiolus puteoserpentis (Logatchev) TaxID=343240 RepID=UPI0010B47B75|nr:DNA polymerase III subunit delta [thiotrophic endosymbiont of Bathymodiolus puteoserpentis (Logatchev)]CAC9574859.1 DNA polymerase III delta subunit (EC 2.7.7.7) [uncultured Gammaproteobacteria bacterium]CAC9578892.1 DNA polymerase III delta subunit (EC 2.7.7.7) [uncultured Gammaproteobacteria bacterium]CAC9583527.1 DNA polymerase III delta subunit (EC 2.7.7.7) [uncultured Gammaproteobacteria bacterium]CAC9631494.1 DNA polymerase III delta subunit (EC 2.7.7.7) [uncultured Gammaproteobacteria